jgi:hypothetical protein
VTGMKLRMATFPLKTMAMTVSMTPVLVQMMALEQMMMTMMETMITIAKEVVIVAVLLGTAAKLGTEKYARTRRSRLACESMHAIFLAHLSWLFSLGSGRTLSFILSRSHARVDVSVVWWRNHVGVNDALIHLGSDASLPRARLK